jgi:hypothetical protein
LSTKDALTALGAFALASLVYTYPLVESPARANRLDSPDALLNSWILSWNLHQLPRDPLHLFDANIFFPEKGVLAYSENLVTGALLAAPLAALTDSPVALYNAVLLLGFVTTAWAAFLLASDVTNDRLAGGLAGILFAFSSFRFAHIPHLQLSLAFGMPLSIYFTRRLLRPGAAALPLAGLAVSIPLTFGSSVYYSVYTATVLPIVALASLRPLAPLDRLRGLRRLAAASVLGSVATLPLVLPYWEKASEGASRTLEEAARFSASGIDFVSSFSRLHPFLPRTEEPLFPGFVAVALAALALLSPKRAGAGSFFLLGVAGVLLAMGPSAGLFSILYETLPPYRALRVPSRAGALFLLAVAILAAAGLSRIRRQSARIALVGAAAAECFAGPLPLRTEVPELPAIYRSVEALEGDGALVELPLPPPERFQDNALYVYRSIFHRRSLVNGYSGFVPESYHEAHRVLMEGSLMDGLEPMSRRGVRYVLAHEGRLGPRKLREIEAARAEGSLALVAESGSDRLYRIGN